MPPKPINPALIFLVVIALWTAVGVSARMFDKNKDAATKRRLFPWWLAIIAIVFVVAIVTLSRSVMMLFLVGPIFALIVLVSWRTTHFCDACNGTVLHLDWNPPATCRHCGAAMGPGETP